MSGVLFIFKIPVSVYYLSIVLRNRFATGVVERLTAAALVAELFCNSFVLR